MGIVEQGNSMLANAVESKATDLAPRRVRIGAINGLCLGGFFTGKYLIQRGKSDSCIGFARSTANQRVTVTVDKVGAKIRLGEGRMLGNIGQKFNIVLKPADLIGLECTRRCSARGRDSSQTMSLAIIGS